ncbi:MAG: VWA domain-containing protein [Pseudomonadales bacterium]
MFDLAQLSHLHFLRPWWLLGVPTILITLRYLSTVRDPLPKWSRIVAPHLIRAMLVRRDRTHWFNPVAVGHVLLLMGTLAVAGPTWERQPSPLVEDEAILVIALDLSSSMSQQDIQPSRLERAKQKIEDLLKLRAGARTGLIVYAGSAHSVIPLTNDADIVRNFLAAVVPEMMPRPGKFPERALSLADAMLSDSTVPGTLLVIADGSGPNSIDAFVKYFDGKSHQLIVLGIGSEETAGDSALDGGFIPLQRDTLKSLAKAGDGYYQQTTLDKVDIRRINRRVNNHLLDVEDDSRPWVDLGYYLIFPFALVFLLWFRKGWTLQWCLAGVLVAGVSWTPAASAEGLRFADLWLTPDQQGRYYFDKGDYNTAAQRFQDPAWRGISLYLDENFAAAAEAFVQIETAQGLYNLGNAWAQGQNYVYAVQAYTKVLQLEPEHSGAQKNRRIIQEIIDEINLMSESQVAEPGEQSKELGDAPLRSEGDQREEWGKREVEQFSADQILTDQRIQELWMKQIQQDPSRFLSVKFQMQLEQGADSGAR